MDVSEASEAADFVGDLRHVTLFQDLDERELRRLGRQFVELAVPRHSIIAREGDETVGFYIVRSGTVAVFREAVGKPVMLLARLHRGEFFGELGIFGEGKHMASVRASEASSILRIERQDLLAFFAEHPEIEQKLRLAAARRHLGHVTAFLDLGRRREVRIHLGQPVQLEDASGSIHKAVLENLSLDGLSLTGAPPDWRVGSTVAFGLGLREGQLQLKGTIVWRGEETVGMVFEKLIPNHDTVIQMAIRVALELRRYGSTHNQTH